MFDDDTTGGGHRDDDMSRENTHGRYGIVSYNPVTGGGAVRFTLTQPDTRYASGELWLGAAVNSRHNPNVYDTYIADILP